MQMQRRQRKGKRSMTVMKARQMMAAGTAPPAALQEGQEGQEGRRVRRGSGQGSDRTGTCNGTSPEQPAAPLGSSGWLSC